MNRIEIVVVVTGTLVQSLLSPTVTADYNFQSAI